MSQVIDIDDTQADFQEGTLTNVIATSAGDLELERPKYYDEGIEYTTIVAGYSSGDGEQSKESDYLYLYVPATNGTNRTYVTDIAIDLTDIDYLLVEWDTNSTSPYGVLLTAGTDKTARARNDENVLKYSREQFSRRWDSLDTTAVSGNRYIKVAIEGAEFDGGGIGKLRVYRIWALKSTFGTRISPILDLSPVGMVANSNINWNFTLPANTNITIETNLSLDNGQTWQGWQTCTNGENIPDLPYGIDTSTAILKCRQTLSTNDVSATPQLHSLTVQIDGEFGAFFMFPF